MVRHSRANRSIREGRKEQLNRMWDKTKRLINSYLDNLIERTNAPDSEVRSVTRGEVARLTELEVQARASAKMLEKELAEVELKLIGVAERAKLLPDPTAVSSEIQNLSAHRDLLRTQIREAASSADKARALREQRKYEGDDLELQSQLTSIQETTAGVHSGFDVNDPASVIDEMRSRMGRSAASEQELKVQEADSHIEAQRKQSKIDELLASYKQSVLEPDQPIVQARPQAHQPASEATPASTPSESAANRSDKDAEDSIEEKTLGRADPSIRPID